MERAAEFLIKEIGERKFYLHYAIGGDQWSVSRIGYNKTAVGISPELGESMISLLLLKMDI